MAKSFSLKKVTIRDAIHGGIELTGPEAAIVDSWWMQRLRFIRQLSTAYLVFPSATHTRFEHSLGAMHLSGQVATRIGFSKTQTELLRLAALLHDVGHGAFAHDVEALLRRRGCKPHEERGIDLIKSTELSDVLKNEGVSLAKLFSVMRGSGIGGMLTSDLGTDRIDYLLRDSYFTGVAYSVIDAERLMESLAFQQGEVMVTEKGRLAAESLLVSRRFMFNVVYFHPAIRISGDMLAKAIDQTIESGEITVQEVENGTDFSLLERLSKTNEIAKRVLERRLFKKALVIDINENSTVKETLARAGAEEQIADELERQGIASDDFTISMPELGRAGGFSVRMVRHDGGIEDVAKTSPLIQALRKEYREAHCIIACDEKNKPKALKAARKLFGKDCGH